MHLNKLFPFVISITISCTFLVSTPILAQELDEGTSLKIEEHLSTGKSLYRQDKFKEAISVWEKALELDPSNSQAQRYIERAKERLQELQPPTPEEIKEIPPEKPLPPPEKIMPEIKPFIPTAPELVPSLEKPPRLLTLKECIQIAVDNSISLKTAKREIKLAKQKVKDAWRALFPAASIKWEEISGTTTGEDFKGREFYLELQQPIYQGGRLANTLRQARINMQVARNNYQKLKNDLVYEVEQAFHILASTKKTYRELVELMTLAKQDYSVAEKELELELQREIDFLNVKNLYQETEYKLLSNQKDLTLAYLTLYQTLNIDSKKQSIDIPEPSPPKILEIDINECQKLAFENRPDLAIKDSLLKFNKYGMRIAMSGNRLKIDLTAAGGYKDEVFITEDLDLQTEWYVGLKGSIPIWLNTAEYSFISQDKVPSAGQTTSTEFQSHTATLRLFDNTAYTSITEAKVNLEKAKDELQKLEKSISFEVKQDFYEYEKSVYQLANSSTKLRLSVVELAIVSSQRDLNLATTNDLLRTRIKLWEAKTGYHQATAGYFTSVAKLNKTIGISEYFNPMGETTLESVHYISPPPLDLSLVRLELQERPILEKEKSRLAYLDSEKIEKQDTDRKGIEIKITEPYKNFGPRKVTGEKQKLDEGELKKAEEKRLAQLKKEEESRLAQLKKEEERKKQEEERQRLAAEKEQKRLEEQKRKEEEKRLAQLKKEEEIKKKEEAEAQARLKREEEKRLAQLKKEEEKRLAQLKKEEERKKQEEEKQRLAAEKEQKRLEEQKRKEEEKRLAQLKKEEERKKKEEAEAQARLKKEEEKHLAQLKKAEAEEEKQRLAAEKEQKRLEEQKRKEEEKRLAQLKKEEEKRLAQLKKEEERKKQEEEKQRLAAEKEQKRLEEQKRKEEEKRLAQLKKEEERKKKEEAEAQARLKKEEERRISEKREKEDIEKLIKKEQEKILAQLKDEEKERKKLQQQFLIAEKKEEKEEPTQDSSSSFTKEMDEYTRAKILASEIAKRKADEEKKKQIKIEKQVQEEKEEYLAQIMKEEEGKKQEEEKQRLTREKKQKRLEEQKRREEEKRLAQLKKAEAEEKARLVREEEKRLAQLKKAEERKKKEEEKRLAQLKKEEEKKKRDEEKKRLAVREEQKRLEEQKKTEEVRRLAQLEKQSEIKPETKPTEHQLFLTKTEEKLLQLQKDKTHLLAKLEDFKTAEQIEISQYIREGEKYYEKQDYTSAIKEWSKALALDFTNPEAQDGIRKAEEALRKK